ncbi:Uma2 family endonuclease [Synechococcales cyanobacterium C]|uniref:Uma2 family endonuclease n=1 Tax=Petrachloros mirabilis ULC683 TaxID=2781853 RepID=A0A8K2A0S7_9CYAN|nr:Uma2 family endonuclease [Petrachloros mirabilis]NCJ08373.1 Uma2 family endonuclease [Petrachloros mirabilis ULC683]
MTLLNLVKLPITTIDLSPGSHLLINDVTWEQYETLLADLGEERRVPRINYCNGILEIMSPLPAHERPHRIIADIVKALLDAQDRPWEDFGSTTFKKPKRAGLEPDTCFYIQNAERVRALMRMDMDTDPPPDLAIEADVTSKTTLDAYATLQVPEVWIYDNGRLTLYLLEDGEYQSGTMSQIFPSLPITTWVPQLVQEALTIGTSAMLCNLRYRLQAENIKP